MDALSVSYLTGEYMETLSTAQELAQVLRRVQSAKDFSNDWHKNIIRWRKLYNLKHYNEAPKPGSEPYVDPTHTNTVDLAVGILQSNEYRWRAKGFYPSSEEEAGSSLVEKTIAAVIDSNASRSQIDMKYEVDINFVRDGGACLYSEWNTDVHNSCYDEQEVLQEDGTPLNSRVYYEMPLRVEVIDPLSVRLLPGGSRRWIGIGRVENASVFDVEQAYDVKLKDFAHMTPEAKIETKNELVNWWEYAYELEPDEKFDTDMPDVDLLKHLKRKPVVRNSVIYAGKFIREPKIMDGYRSLPFRVGFFNPTSMDDSSMWHNILSAQEHSVKELEDSINMRKRLLAMYSNLPLMFVSPHGRSIQLDPGIGKVITLAEGEDAGFPKWEGTPPDFDKHIDLLRSRVQQSGFSDVMFGQGPSGISGYALTQLGDQNRIRLVPAIAHLENLWTWAARDWLDLIKEFAPEYYFEIYGQIRNADFAERMFGGDVDGYKVRCIIKPEFPNEKVRDHALASQVRGIVSEHTIMEEYLNIQQPDEERIRKLQEEAEQMPMAKQFALMSILQQKAAMGDQAAQMAVQAMMQTMMGQGGRPEEPPNPEQPLGLQSSTGEAQPQQYQGQADVQAMERQQNAAPQMVEGGVL